MVDENRREVISIGFINNDKGVLEFEDADGHRHIMPLESCEKQVEIDLEAVSIMVLIRTYYILKDGKIAGVKPVIQQLLGRTFD